MLGLAKWVVKDAEGSNKLVEIAVRGARSDADARRVAETVAHSPLVKTALFGEDANWGRILAAAGRSGAMLDPGKVDIFIGPIQMVACGSGCGKDAEAEATRVLKQARIHHRDRPAPGGRAGDDVHLRFLDRLRQDQRRLPQLNDKFEALNSKYETYPRDSLFRISIFEFRIFLHAVGSPSKIPGSSGRLLAPQGGGPHPGRAGRGQRPSGRSSLGRRWTRRSTGWRSRGSPCGARTAHGLHRPEQAARLRHELPPCRQADRDGARGRGRAGLPGRPAGQGLDRAAPADQRRPAAPDAFAPLLRPRERVRGGRGTPHPRRRAAAHGRGGADPGHPHAPGPRHPSRGAALSASC